MTTLSIPVEDRLTFPPFPTVPSGVTIIPFKAFKERGIQMFPADGDQVERDGLGIPTVELRVKHGTDSCKTETTRKRKVEPVPTASRTPGARKEWWDYWNDNEHLKMTGPYNPHTLPVDRLYEVAADFRKTRSWPQGQTGISSLWDQFRLFVGLLSNTPVWTRTDKQPPQDSDDESQSDDEEEFARDTAVIEASTERGNRQPLARVRPRPPYALYDSEPVPVSSDQEVKDLLDTETARREEQMVEFLNDPELKIRVFLSSYIRKQGLIWADRNLINIPRLFGFFIRFIIRNRAFPEIEREFQRALDIIELADKELILTSKIAKQIPDDFCKGCFQCFGRKSEGYKPIDPAAEDNNIWGNPGNKKPDDSNGTTVTPQDEPEAKRVKLDTKESDYMDLAANTFDAELKAANMIKIDNDDIMQNAEALEAIRDNVDSEIDAVPAWGGKSEGWGLSTDDADDSWGAPIVDWEPAIKPSLLPFLGPTTFPLTHTTGVVECSVRRIKSYTAPPAANTLPQSPLTSEESADAVEIELERHFAKVVLSPWLDWDHPSDDMPHMAKPRILETSVGPIHGVVGTDGRVEPPAAAGDAEKAAVGLQPHDPCKDDITLLVQPALVPLLSAGMGLGGTWVQIARNEDFGGENKKKKKSKAMKVTTRYWYIDELVLTLPSYHT